MISSESFDFVVIGSGAAGLAAAITARLKGLRVLVVEKDAVVGGTSATSGGWLWIPGNGLCKESETGDIERAWTYLAHELGNNIDAVRLRAFLDNGPRMLSFFQDQTALKMGGSPTFPDYHSEAPGAGRGRSVFTEPFDGRALGPRLSELRRPLTEATFLGMNLGSGSELVHFINAKSSLSSFIFVIRRLAGHAWDILRYGRGMRLSNGNALMARLFKSAVDLDIPIWLSARAKRLLTRDGAITGVQIETASGVVEIEAKRGVLLATGGFSHDEAATRRFFPESVLREPYRSPTPAAMTGDGLTLGEAVGGAVATDLAQPAAWMPVSVLNYGSGREGVFPHVIDRAKPGVIAVTREGKRFVNEAQSYHDVVQAMIAQSGTSGPIEAFLICDHRAIRNYGLGHVKPAPVPFGWHLRAGYLKRGRDLPELAAQAGIEADNLMRTVSEFNASCREGRDPQFGKGDTAYNRFQGDARHTPNPCLAPLEQGPFYAVRIRPGDLGTFIGLRTDEFGRVLNSNGDHVRGLYAAGNCAASVMGGNYPGAGINLGPGMTFGYLAACHAAGVES